MEHHQECECDHCLLAQMQAADSTMRQRGWDAWYRRDSATLHAFMQRRCQVYHCPEQCEDLVQDCFMIGFRNVSNGRYVDQGKALRAYLYGIARRLLYETVRLQRREMGFPQQEDQEVIAPAMEIVERVYVNELLERVRTLCEQQSPIAQRVVLSLYAGGKSTDEVAAELSKSEGNVRTIAHRTVNGIMRDLAQSGISLSSYAVRSCIQELSNF